MNVIDVFVHRLQHQIKQSSCVTCTIVTPFTTNDEHTHRECDFTSRLLWIILPITPRCGHANCDFGRFQYE